MKKVWIDAGHGGKDPGATANGLQEKDIVLALSLAVKKRLESEYDGVKVFLSRSTDVFVVLPDRTAAANREKADILVSIHCNAGGGSGGFESYRYPHASAASIAFHHVLHSEIMSALRQLGITDRGQKTKNLHMLRESAMPAVLTENLFVDVAADAALLKRQEVMSALAAGHTAGIAKALGLQRKGGNQVDQPGRDIHVVSPWAAAAWDEMTKNGYFDGSRPGAPITREECAIVFNRLRKDILSMLSGNQEQLKALEKRLQALEDGK